jgi:metal-responsive CopG/Arc/MetJ family transcriptional regulator
MGRSTKVLAFSVPPAIAREIERTARAEQKTKSELLRDMWEAYLIARDKEEFSNIQRSARRAAREAGLVIQTEDDVDRILHER